MTIAVRYYTRSGNTEKLAQAIAEAASVQAENVSVPLTEKAELLFLGSSYYAFDVDDAVKLFITENKEKIGRIVCFGSSAGMGSTRKQIVKVAEPLGIEVAKEAFHCYGSFGPFHKGRPNAQDVQDAAAFAEKMKG